MKQRFSVSSWEPSPTHTPNTHTFYKILQRCLRSHLKWLQLHHYLVSTSGLEKYHAFLQGCKAFNWLGFSFFVGLWNASFHRSISAIICSSWAPLLCDYNQSWGPSSCRAIMTPLLFKTHYLRGLQTQRVCCCMCVIRHAWCKLEWKQFKWLIKRYGLCFIFLNF